MNSLSRNYGDRDGWIWFDGALVPWRDARVHVLAHALNYGGCVFEGVRSYGGNPFLLAEHCRRLVRSCELIGMRTGRSAETVEAAAREVIAANGLGDGYVRPLVFRGSDEIEMFARNVTVHVAIAAWEWPAIFGDGRKRSGIPVTISSYRRTPPECVPPQAKVSGTYLTGTLARFDAVNQGFSDAIMLDMDGTVAEATAANIFLVKDGTLVTPIADRFLNGLTRQFVIQLARHHGIAVDERRVLPDELTRADEIFLAGTAYEIQPVSAVGQHTFGDNVLTRRIADWFGDAVRDVRPAKLPA